MQVKYTNLTSFIDLQRKLLDSNEGDDECLFFFFSALSRAAKKTSDRIGLQGSQLSKVFDRTVCVQSF